MSSKRICFQVIALLISALGLLIAGPAGFAAELKSATPIQLDTGSVPSTAFQRGLGKWSHGSYIRLDKSQLAVPAFYTFSPDGKLLSSVDFTIPNAERVYVDDFDIGLDHSIIVCGDAWSADGQVAYFIARVSSDGQKSQLIRTTPYWPHLISVAPDGTIWTVGSEIVFNKAGQAAKVNPEANVLRHFNLSGALIESAFPKSAFSNTTQFMKGYLVATKDRVGWYEGTTGSGEYTELLLATKVTNRYAGLPGGITDRVSGFTLTDNDQVFLTHDVWAGNARQRVLYTLDRSAGNWSVIPWPTNDRNQPALRGSEGTSLVFTGPTMPVFVTFSVRP
jgi:hypothetical protein